MNNNRILNLFLQFLQIFMQMCVAVPVVNALLHGFLGYEKFQVFNTLYIGIVVMIYYFAKSYIKNGKLAYLVHFAAAFSIWYVCNGSSEDKMMIFIPALAFMYYSLKRSSEKPIPGLDMGIIAATYIIGSTLKAESGIVIPFYCCIVYVIAFLIWYNMSNLNDFVMENSNAKSFNAEQAVNVNSLMLAIFMVISVLCMIIVPRLHIQDAIRSFLGGLWKLMVAGFRSLNIPLPQGDYELEQSLNKPKAEGVSDLGIVPEMSEGNDILNIIFVAFAVVVSIGLLVLVIKSLKNIRYNKSQGLDVKEFVKPDFTKKKEKKPKEKTFMFRNMPNEAAVRKFYKKTIRKNLEKGREVDSKNTPCEITKSVMGWDESASEITEIYEKARYSREQITAEDVAVMKRKYSEK